MGSSASAILAISLGASMGALLRWALSVGMNHWWPALPLGTLVANLLGGYLIGLALALLAQNQQLPPEWRLFIVTGFLGGLTTFSTFSAEVVTALEQGRLGWAAATVTVHVLGSLLLTLAGLATPAVMHR
jgi:CrcB protein